MGKLLVILILGIGGYFAWKHFNPRLAPPGVYYVVTPFNLTLDDGIHGFPRLKEVRLVREEGDMFFVTDGKVEASAPAASFTNDLDEVDRMRATLPRATPAATPEARITNDEFQLAKLDAELERLRRHKEVLELELQEILSTPPNQAGIRDMGQLAEETREKIRKNALQTERLRLQREHLMRDMRGN